MPRQDDATVVSIARIAGIARIATVIVGVAAGGCSSCSSPKVTMATPAEAAAFANALAAKITKGDAAADAFALDVGVDRAAAKLELHDWRAMLRSYGAVTGAKAALSKPKALPSTSLGTMCAHGGTIALLRMRAVGTETSALFHYTDAGGGIGYMDFIIADVDGRPRVIDWMSSSTCVSQAASALATGMGTVDAGEKDALKRMSDGLDAAAALKKLAESAKAEKWSETLAAYDALPERLKQDRSALVLRLAAAEHVSPAAALVARTALRDKSDDPECRALLSIDIELEHGDYAAAAAAVDDLDRAVGGDSWLDVTRANIARKAAPHTTEP